MTDDTSKAGKALEGLTLGPDGDVFPADPADYFDGLPRYVVRWRGRDEAVFLVVRLDEGRGLWLAAVEPAETWYVIGSAEQHAVEPSNELPQLRDAILARVAER